MSDSGSEGRAAGAEEVADLTNPDVVTKYKLAAQIANHIRPTIVACCVVVASGQGRCCCARFPPLARP